MKKRYILYFHYMENRNPICANYVETNMKWIKDMPTWKSIIGKREKNGLNITKRGLQRGEKPYRNVVMKILLIEFE